MKPDGFDDLIVTMPKSLIHASYRLSVTGQRLESLMFAKIIPGEWMTGEILPVEITEAEWRHMFSASKNCLRNMKKAAAELLNNEVVFKHDPKIHNFLEKVEYMKEDGRFILTFNSEFVTALNINNPLSKFSPFRPQDRYEEDDEV